MNVKNKQPFLIGFFLCAFMVLTIGATYYKQVTGPTSSTDNAILRWDAIRGEKAQNSGITISDLGTIGNGTWSIDSSGAAIFTSASYSTLSIGSLSLTNPIPSSGITNATASRFAVFGADYRLTNDVAETGTGAPVRAGSPTLTGTPLVNSTNFMAEIATKAPSASPSLTGTITLNDTLTYEQTALSAHSEVTNFVANPTVSPYQTINSDLTLPFAGIRFIHATNTAAGRQTTVLVFAGTNATVTVALNSQFYYNTNLISLSTGQVLPVSFYCYGSDPTNVIATIGTIYVK